MTSRFITQLSIEAADDGDTGQWVLTRPVEYASDIARAVIIVPTGFRTDFASTPRPAGRLSGATAASNSPLRFRLFFTSSLP